MSDIAETFRLLVDDALALDPDAIRSTIRSTIDDGLRAARYDGTGGRDADQSSHPERMAIHGRRDPAWADLDLIDHHAERFICAVTELALRSHSRGAPRSWDEAVQDAHLLAEMDAVGILERTGQRPSRWVHQAGDAVHDLALIRDRHASREARDWEQSWTSGLADEECCRLCLDHVNLRSPRKAKQLCQMHLRLFNEAGGIDPPQWLTEEFRRIGSPAGPDWKRARSRWLQSEGVQDRSA